MNINSVTYVLKYMNDMNDMYIMKRKNISNEKINVNDMFIYHN